MDLVAQLRDDAENALTPGSDDACCALDLLHQAANEIENLRRNLNSRDDFIGRIGQWDSFVAQLPK